MDYWIVKKLAPFRSQHSNNQPIRVDYRRNGPIRSHNWTMSRTISLHQLPSTFPFKVYFDQSNSLRQKRFLPKNAELQNVNFWHKESKEISFLSLERSLIFPVVTNFLFGFPWAPCNHLNSSIKNSYISW